MALYTLDRIERFEQDVRKSRFLAIACPVESEAEAKQYLAALSDLSANHNCWAFRIGQTYRFSDDGEPSGTAGAPMLDALTSAGLSDVVAVVTRYFGGVLLGAGGLTRAYRAAVAEAVLVAERVTRAPRQRVAILAPYDVAAQLEAEARRRGWGIGEARYGEAVERDFAVAEREVEALRAVAAELSAGAARVTLGEVSYVDLA